MLFREEPTIAKVDDDRKGMKDYYKAKIEEVGISILHLIYFIVSSNSEIQEN